MLKATSAVCLNLLMMDFWWILELSKYFYNLNNARWNIIKSDWNEMNLDHEIFHSKFNNRSASWWIPLSYFFGYFFWCCWIEIDEKTNLKWERYRLSATWDGPFFTFVYIQEVSNVETCVLCALCTINNIILREVPQSMMITKRNVSLDTAAFFFWIHFGEGEKLLLKRKWNRFRV